MNLKNYFLNWRYSLTGFFVLAVIGYFFIEQPVNFPLHTLVSVEKGVTIKQTADFLEQKKFISSAFWFVALNRLLSGGRGVLAGDYYFDKRQSYLPLADDWRAAILV
ncbi:MAG: hypothetical protein AAB905_01105 [Patescibacteria group bacterium]